MSSYIQGLYVKTIFGLATPALIISVLYLLVLCIYLICKKRKKAFEINLEVCELMPGERKKLILSVMGYVILIFLSVFLRDFLEAESFVMQISKTYLQYEPLIFLLLFSFLCSAFLTKKNQDTHIKVCNSIFHYLIWISLGAGIIAGQIDYTYWKNVIIIVLVGILNGLLGIIKISVVKETEKTSYKFDLISYSAVNTADELFPSHSIQAKDIANVIEYSSSEPFSICLSGEWGCGKTSVINGVIDILTNREEKLYDIIYINALELDDKKSMLKYLMMQIKGKLKLQGVYVGINSEYKEFISSITGTLISSSIGGLLQKKISDDNDYREQKQRLEQIIERIYNNGKLIVVIDDIERCDEKTAREYLFLIKEIATMKNCVSVFVTDYNMLNEVVRNTINEEPPIDFLNKFFNYKIDLREEEPCDILNFYDRFFEKEDSAFWNIYKIICKSPGTWYNDVVNGMEAKIRLLEKDCLQYHSNDEVQKAMEAKVKESRECLNLFNRLMQTPRNVVKFYNVFRNHALYCGEELFSTPENEEVQKYINSRNIGQVLYLISFIEIMMPTEYQLLKEKGPQYLAPAYDDIISNVNRRLLVELAQGLLFGGFSEFGKLNGYIKADIEKFVGNFISRKMDLRELVNPFTSQEEKWINAIHESDDQMIAEHWEEIVLAVFQKVPNREVGIDDKWRNECFLSLLEFAEKQVGDGIWKSDKLFGLLDSNSHIERYWSLGNGLMQTFWKHLSGSTVYTKPSEKVMRRVNQFMSHYAYARSNIMYRLAHYLIPLEQTGIKTEDIQEYMLNSNKTFNQNITSFLKRFEEIIPGLSFSKDDWYYNFHELADKIRKYLMEMDMLRYSDVQGDVESLFDSAEELKSMENVMKWIGCEKSNKSDSNDLQLESEDIDEMIHYFREQFKVISIALRPQSDIEKEFSSFFTKLRNAKGILITHSQLEQLHELVEKFVVLFAASSLPYRRILLNIKERQSSMS